MQKSARAALWQVFIGSGAAYSFARSANQLQALYLLYFGTSASHSLPNRNYQMQTIESLSGGGGKLPNANYQILIPWGGLQKTIEHMSEMKFAYIFHKPCINCKN